MAGTKEGAIKGRDKLLRDDPDYYHKLGKIGGKSKGRKGFAANPALAAKAGKKGGQVSRRTK